MRTEAAILVDTSRPLEFVDLEIPALRAGQALVEIAYSGVCHTQVLEARGRRGEDKWLPHCLGHEAVGTVLETGAAVTKVKPGDRVVLSWIKGQGIEAGGSHYGWNGRKVNAGGVTTFQRRSVVSENRLTLLPQGLPMDVAVLLGCATPTGMGAVLNIAKVSAGEAVAVFGAGGVGLNACMAASFAGAMPVIAVDPNPTRRALALRYGATHVVEAEAGDVLTAIHSLAPGGVDVAIEAAGIPAVMATALAATRPQGGRAVVIGNARFGARLDLDPSQFNQGKSLLGAWGGDSVPDRDTPRFGRLLRSGRFDIGALLSRPYALAEADRALDDLEHGRVGRPLIDMSL